MNNKNHFIKSSPIIGLLLIIFLWGCSEKESRETSDANPSPDATTGQVKEQENQEASNTDQPTESENLNGSPSDADSKQTNQTAADSGSTTYRIQFERAQSYGSTEEVIVGQIATFAVDGRGRVFVADRDQNTIHVYNPEGSYRTSLGRQGRGPGEFSGISTSTTMNIHSNQLFVSDISETVPVRINIYSLQELSFSHTVLLLAENRGEFEELKGYTPDRFYPFGDGTFLVSYTRRFRANDTEERYTRYFIQAGNGQIVSDQVLEQKNIRYLTYKHPAGGTIFLSFPFFGKSLFAVSDDGQLYSAWTQDFLIEVRDSNGKYLRSIDHPFEKRMFSLEEYLEDEEVGEVGRRMLREASDMPATWPALESMFLDDENRLWVSTITEDLQIYEWWVLQETGEPLAKFTWPRVKSVETVNNGYLYARETREETGLQQIVRYRIEMD